MEELRLWNAIRCTLPSREGNISCKLVIQRCLGSTTTETAPESPTCCHAVADPRGLCDTEINQIRTHNYIEVCCFYFCFGFISLCLSYDIFVFSLSSFAYRLYITGSFNIIRWLKFCFDIFRICIMLAS